MFSVMSSTRRDFFPARNLFHPAKQTLELPVFFPPLITLSNVNFHPECTFISQSLASLKRIRNRTLSLEFSFRKFLFCSNPVLTSFVTLRDNRRPLREFCTPVSYPRSQSKIVNDVDEIYIRSLQEILIILFSG